MTPKAALFLIAAAFPRANPSISVNRR